MTTPSQAALDAVLNACAEREEEGSTRWPGMTYEQGVAAAIRWLTEPGWPSPMGG